MSNLSHLTREQLEAMVLAANKPKAITVKVSEKGAVSVYGMGRFPVTLYAEQWERLFASRERIETFIAANRSILSVKGVAN